MFWLLTSFSELQVNKQKLLFDRLTSFPRLCVSMLFKSSLKIKIESRLHCIDIYDDCILVDKIWINTKFYFLHFNAILTRKMCLKLIETKLKHFCLTFLSVGIMYNFMLYCTYDYENLDTNVLFCEGQNITDLN